MSLSPSEVTIETKRKILDFSVAFFGILIIKIALSAAYGYLTVFKMNSLELLVIYFELSFLLLTVIIGIYIWNRRRFSAYGLFIAGLLMLFSVFK